MSDSQKVTYGKPKVGGGIYTAPIGTTLPTDATSQLSAAFKSLGYVAEDGLVNNNTPESESIKAWGGDTVMVVQTSREDTFAFTLIEALNIDVLKVVYGQKNVTGDLDDGIKIAVNTKQTEDVVLVVDMVLKGDVLKRIVVPSSTLSEVGEIAYVDNETVGYATTMMATPDTEGNTHYEYIQKTTPTEPGE